MASMKKSGLSILMMVALVATCFLQLLQATRIDLNEPVLEGPKVVYVKEGKGSEEACCDSCLCTRSIPPQCHCSDVKTSCHSACDLCICTRSLPPKCRCADVTDNCVAPCSAAHSRNQIAS